jgi:hypothetical protein
MSRQRDWPPDCPRAEEMAQESSVTRPQAPQTGGEAMGGDNRLLTTDLAWRPNRLAHR